MTTIRVFTYLEQLDAFVVTDEYRALADQLGLTEWNPIVWIGRLFALDNDYGEHWFDNWEEREARQDKARQLGIPSEQLMIIAPDRFKNGVDGPCHPPALRKQFWTDVLQSLTLSYATLFAAARQYNAHNAELQQYFPGIYIADLEARIAAIQRRVENRRQTTVPAPRRSPSKPPYTSTQGQYLAFIYHYTRRYGQPPAEADMQRYFNVSPPSVHQMVVKLTKRGFIERIPRKARSIRVLLPPETLPELGE